MNNQQFVKEGEELPIEEWEVIEYGEGILRIEPK